ncbi:MAG: YabP/YqfC family sporulation protein [Clostridia bacterium]|nr:YabP/YqfC family sporulation protein [Clostridia bacterium]
MNNKRKLTNRIDSMLEMPKEIYTNLPKITIMGFEEMMIENYKNILEYEDYFVRINTHIGVLNINGYGLNLEKMTDEHIRIIGKIESIDLERNND